MSNFLKRKLKPCSILNLESGYVKTLKSIVEQKDRVEAQRGVVKLSEKIWCGYDSNRGMFSDASFNMLHKIVESFEKGYKRSEKPVELIRMLERFRVRQEKIEADLKAAGEPEKKGSQIPKSVDLRGVAGRHFLKLVNQPLGVDVTGFKLSLGRACAQAHKDNDVSDSDLFIIGSFLLSLFMQNGKEWFQFRIEKNKDFQQSYIAPTEKSLEGFLENNYLDLTELPLLLPGEKIPDDLLDHFELLFEEKNGKNTYLHKTEPKTGLIENVLKRFSRVGLKINKKLLNGLMVNNEVLLTYKEGDDNDVERLKSNADYFNQRSILGIADVYSNVEEFYLPMFYDGRTRLYAKTTYLNYQGGKLALALLMFSKGKTINESGLRYFQMYGYGLYGKKASHEDMVKGFHEHTDKIIQMEKDFIFKAKEPFLFAAFCLEYRDYLKTPSEYVSHFPVLIDCTCSGLQHLAAITQDCVLAKKVNLTENIERLDIYSSMAILLENILCMDPEYRGIKINRDFVKRPIMTIAYSATLEGLTEQLLAFFTFNPEEKIFYKNDQPSIKLTKQQIRGLAKKILDLLYSEHPTLKLLLNYLQMMAKCMSDLDLPVVGTTPVGVSITQKYNERKHLIIKNTSYKWLKTVSLPVGTKNIDKRKQSLGVMPNMVHSLDASNIYELIKNLDEEIPIFTIHDCFAGLASDMSLIEGEVKKAFVSIYCNENGISKFHRSNLSLIEAHYKVDESGVVLTSETNGKPIVFPKMPVLGDFDVNEVLKASFMLN